MRTLLLLSLIALVARADDNTVNEVLALALSGFAAMGYEVLFIRVISLAFGLLHQQNLGSRLRLGIC